MGELRGPFKELQQTLVQGEKGHYQVEYSIIAGEDSVPLSAVIGDTLEIHFEDEKSCVHCGRRVKKLYQNGYCFPCVTTLAECDLCIVKPHECHYHLGTCRDESFADSHCMIPHYVYLADSSAVKVGLTRKGRQLKRWTDQGATSAVLLGETPTRKAAGELEMFIARNLPDKTDWRKMLRDTGEADADLRQIREDVVSGLDAEYEGYAFKQPQSVVRFSYPRLPGFEPKLKSMSLDKEKSVKGTLCGIKGQYLMFEEGVFNVRKHTGFHVSVTTSSSS